MNNSHEKNSTTQLLGLEVIDCTGILLGNADLELSHIERIEGVCVMPLENGHE